MDALTPNVALHHSTSDLSGAQIGHLKVLRPDGRTRDLHVKWLCQCVCGNTKSISSQTLRKGTHTQSCGCVNRTLAQLRRKNTTPWNEGKNYVVEDGMKCYKTRHGWAKAVRTFYGNKCEMCGWDKTMCDVHHRSEKSKGGVHTLSNGIVLCPNCHRLEHEKTQKRKIKK